MAAESHALLGASSAHRWQNCPPSARICESIADKASEFAEEGTRAHLLCEHKLKRMLGLKADPLPEGVEFDDEMQECAQAYAEYCSSLVADAGKGAVPAVEVRVDYSNYVPEGYGTADFVLVGDGFIHVADFKYGRGVEVSAKMNPQGLLYLLGAINAYGVLFEIETAIFTVFQPRLGNVSEFAISRKALEQWGETVVKPAAELAWKGEGAFRSGSHCRWCRIKDTCRERAETNLAIAQFDFKEPATLSDAEIAEVLGKAEEVAAWANDVKDYVLSEALKGKRFPGWKVVEGRSIRKISDEAKAAEAVLAVGKDPYERKLLSITDLTKLLGAKRFNELLGGLVYKPPGKPTLAPENDKRPEYAATKAAEDFNDN